MTALNMWLKIGEITLKNKKTPMRRCIGCMESKPKDSMLRIACYEGEIAVDLTGKAKGRGVYICPEKGCIDRIRKNELCREVSEWKFLMKGLKVFFRS